MLIAAESVPHAGVVPVCRRAREAEWLAAWRERNSQAKAQAVGDWRAAIDALQSLDVVPNVPVGYCGFSMGTRGIPLATAEPRITGAVLGLFGHPAGDRVVVRWGILFR